MTKIVGTTTTGIIFSDASPKKPGESIAEYTERLINEAEEGEQDGQETLLEDGDPGEGNI